MTLDEARVAHGDDLLRPCACGSTEYERVPNLPIPARLNLTGPPGVASKSYRCCRCGARWRTVHSLQNEGATT